MAGLACCLNQTLVEHSQEEAEWFQSCRPAVETGKEGKGKSVIEKGNQSSAWTYVDRSFTGCIYFQEKEVEIEDEWFTVWQGLIQHYNVCNGLNQVEWRIVSYVAQVQAPSPPLPSQPSQVSSMACK